MKTPPASAAELERSRGELTVRAAPKSPSGSSQPAAGLLGRNILGTGFDSDLAMRQVAGTLGCGEETALVASVEGRGAVPQARAGPT